VSTDEIWNGDRTSITFALGLLSELPGALSEHTLVFHTDIPEEHDWGNVEVIDRYANAKADTYLSFSQGYFEEIAGVTTVFDFDLWQEPVNFVWKLFGRTGKDPLRYLRSEAKLIVTNENFRQTLVGQGIEPSKIINVGYGLPDKNQRILPADQVTRRITKEVYGKEHSYFYAPASGHESDNLERLFAAYDIFRTRVPEPVRLLVQSMPGRRRSPFCTPTTTSFRAPERWCRGRMILDHWINWISAIFRPLYSPTNLNLHAPPLPSATFHILFFLTRPGHPLLRRHLRPARSRGPRNVHTGKPAGATLHH